MLHSDGKRVGLLGFPTCSSTQWSRIAFAAFVHCPYPEATSVGAAEASTYKKKHPDEGIREMYDFCTSCMAILPWQWNTRSGAAKGLSQKGFLTALREKGVRSRDYPHTLRKVPLASTHVAVVVAATRYDKPYTLHTIPPPFSE